MAKEKALEFSKFYPKDQSFYAVNARVSHGDDFFLNITLGDGDNKVTYFVSEHNWKEMEKQIKSMMNAFEESLTFLQKAVATPVLDDAIPAIKWFDNVQKAVSTKAPAKKAAKKKSVAK
jgi:hypothetical protein